MCVFAKGGVCVRGGWTVTFLTDRLRECGNLEVCLLGPMELRHSGGEKGVGCVCAGGWMVRVGVGFLESCMGFMCLSNPLTPPSLEYRKLGVDS